MLLWVRLSVVVVMPTVVAQEFQSPTLESVQSWLASGEGTVLPETVPRWKCWS